MKDLSKLKVGKVFKSEDEYSKMYSIRIEKLQQHLNGCKDEELKEGFTRCISLTEKCHQLATETFFKMEKVVRDLPNNSSDMLERVITKLSKQKTGSTDKTPILNLRESPEIAAFIQEAWDSATEFLRECVQSEDPKIRDRLLTDMIDERFGHIDIWKKTPIIENIAILKVSLEGYESNLKVCKIVFDITRIYRGILYAGILKTYGATLEREELIDQLKDIGFEAIGTIIPGLGLAKSSYKFLRRYLEMEEKLEKIQNADFVAEYIENYIGVLSVWPVLMESLNLHIDTIYDQL